jgi:hypothetical protein
LPVYLAFPSIANHCIGLHSLHAISARSGDKWRRTDQLTYIERRSSPSKNEPAVDLYTVEDLFVRDVPEVSDCIIAFGSDDAVELKCRAMKAVELFKSGFSDRLLLTGKYPRRKPRRETEAARMRVIALAEGVPAGNILLEDQSADTHANVRNSRTSLARQAMPNPRQILIVSNEWHMCRCRLIMAGHFPTTRVLCCPTLDGGNRDDWESAGFRSAVENELRVLNRQVEDGLLPRKPRPT